MIPMNIARPMERPNVKIVKPEKLRPVAGHVAVALDKLMLVWGGYYMTDQNFERYNKPKDLLVYDTVFDKWFCFETSGELPPENSGACAVRVDTTVYVFGGFCDNLYDYAHLYALDLRTLIWRHLLPTTMLVPTVRHKLVGWHHKNRLYYFGGYGPPPQLARPSEVEMRYLQANSSEFTYDGNLHFWNSWNSQLISFDLRTNDWELHPLLGNAPSARAAHSAVYVPETAKVFLFGGRVLQERMNDLFVLDLPTLIWTKIDTTDGPRGRSWHTLVAVDSSRLLLYGGFSQDAIPLNDSWYFDTKARKWIQLKRDADKKQRLWHTAVAIDGSCYTFGGCKSNILATDTIREFANDLYVISASPKSLFEQCLDYVDGHRQYYRRRLAQLPGPLYEKLQFIASERRQKSIKTPLELLRV